jgi:peptidoglycan/LPS O-acetylase OafA/YrhL
LITSLLLTEYAAAGHIRLRAFWTRRARRLLPALLLVLAVTVVGSRLLLPSADQPPGAPGQLRADAIAALLYVANWRMIYRGGGYFEQTATPSALQHTWSLGIEEQFYLLWPLLLVLLLWLSVRLSNRLLLLAVCIAGTLASAVAAAIWYHPFDVNRAYYGTDTRAQALLVGCALAILLTGREHELSAGRGWRRTIAILSALGVAGCVLAAALAHGSDAWLYRGGFLAVAVAVAAVLAHAVLAPGSATARLLAVPPLVWLGRISYGVYLWHWPLFQALDAARTGLAGPALLALRLAVTLAVATASYLLVERPLRRGRVPRRHAHARPVPGLVPGMAVGAMGCVAALVITMTATAPQGAGLLAAGSAARSGIAPLAPGPGAVLPAPAKVAAPTSPMRRPGRKPGKLPRIAFFGDSVSWTLGTYLPATPGLSVSVRAIEGCGIARLPDIMELGTPHTNYPGCDHWDRRWRAGIAADDPDVVMILLDRWELMDRNLNGHWTHVGQPDYDAYLAGELHLAISIAGSRGARVVLLTAPYTHRAERPDGGLYSEDQPSRVDAWNALLRKVAAQDPTLTVLDLNKRVCPNGVFTWSIGGLRVRSDGLHFTPQGVQQWIAPWLIPQVTTIATR